MSVRFGGRGTTTACGRTETYANVELGGFCRATSRRRNLFFSSCVLSSKHDVLGGRASSVATFVALRTEHEVPGTKRFGVVLPYP